MDGLHVDSKEKDQSSRVFVIAATNRIDNLDPALRRPGRFDREIYVGLPDATQRLKILRIHTKEWRTEFKSDRDFRRFLKSFAVHKTEGFSGADLKALCNETFVNAIHRCCPQLMASKGYDESIARTLRDGVIIKMEDFQKTIDGGFKPSTMRSGEDAHHHRYDARKLDSLGEDGHNVLNRLLHRVDVYINRTKHGEPGSVPSRAMDVDSSDSDTNDHHDEDDDEKNYIRSVTQQRLICKFYDRIIICGEDKKRRKVVMETLLHRLDIANVQYVSFAMMASTVCREEMYGSVLTKIKLAITSGIGVLVFRDLDITLSHYPRLMENVLLSNVNEMARDHNVLVVATARSWRGSDCWENEWPQAVFKLFDRDSFHLQSIQ